MTRLPIPKACAKRSSPSNACQRGRLSRGSPGELHTRLHITNIGDQAIFAALRYRNDVASEGRGVCRRARRRWTGDAPQGITLYRQALATRRLAADLICMIFTLNAVGASCTWLRQLWSAQPAGNGGSYAEVVPRAYTTAPRPLALTVRLGPGL